MQEISFVVDGLTLRGTIFYPEKMKDKSPAVYFLHGWGSSEDTTKGRAEALSKIGFIAMTFSMRGCGKSDGTIQEYVRQDYLNDALAAYDFLSEQQGVDKENMSVIGASFGGYIATLVTCERGIKNLVLRAPGNYSGDLTINHSVFSGEDTPEVLSPKFRKVIGQRTLSIEALSHFSGNVLVVESENDATIPHGIIQDYMNAVQDKTKLTHVVIKDADHGLTEETFKIEYTKILTDWFANKL